MCKKKKKVRRLSDDDDDDDVNTDRVKSVFAFLLGKLASRPALFCLAAG